MSKIQEVIDDLQGSCDSFDPTEWSDAEILQLDEQIFHCVVCGWWYEMSDLSAVAADEMICLDCNLDEVEE